MDDLEITRLCAEAMGLHLLPASSKGTIFYRKGCEYNGLMTSPDHRCLFIESGAYAPLEDDAQAMELVKTFQMTITWTNAIYGKWRARVWFTGGKGQALHVETDADDLLRAICECIAQMQQAKGSGQGESNSRGDNVDVDTGREHTEVQDNLTSPLDLHDFCDHAEFLPPGPITGVWIDEFHDFRDYPEPERPDLDLDVVGRSLKPGR